MTVPTPSPELAAWIESRVAAQTGYFGDGAAKAAGALALHETQFYVYALRPDGTLVRVDFEALSWPSCEETDARRVYAAMRHGAAKFPQLESLVPPRPVGVGECVRCHGRGAWMRADGVVEQCIDCDALGYRVG